MKRPVRCVAFTALSVIGFGCAGIASPAAQTGAPQPASEHSSLSFRRLQSMGSLTAYEAVQAMPSYFSRLNQQPAPRVLLFLDGSRTYSLDVLKSIRAADLFEIRVIDPTQSIASAGDLELIVTTLGGHNRIH